MATAGQRAVNSRRRGNQLPLLQDRLILNRFFCRQFGFENFKEMREYLQRGRHTEQEGWEEDGHSFLFHVLKNLPGCLISPDKLAEYDLRIKEYLERLNRFRTPPVELKYFQYLALLFTEIYLDRLFNEKEALLAALNAFVLQQNEKLSPAALPYPEFTEGDLNKLAFWMATGSGKTIIMHINLWQYLAYSKREHRNILLVTPNEGLSRQHLEQFRLSGIIAVRHGESAGSLTSPGNPPVAMIEITKLTEKKRGGGLSVEVDSFGPDNLLFVDEGHRGASGEVWRDLRRRLAEDGFTFEYSATFGQIVNGAGQEKRKDLLKEYSGAILFNYSYPYFHGDGYGKDYHILNLRDESAAFNEWILLGNLLSFYEQLQVYGENGEALRLFNMEKPLWVFVGHSVTSGSSQQDRDTLTDVQEIVAFFHKFLSNAELWAERIARILQAETGLENQQGEDIFSHLFPYLKEKGFTPSEIYEGILKYVFHAREGETLRALQLKVAPGEIGLQAGAESPYFGVINIGDVAGLMKLLQKQGIPCDEENITGSLFDSINDPRSRVNILIGSRKFMEGWDSFRVASMGLMHIGRGEGSQIIQLFGRGVRLWGRHRSLKRSSALAVDDTPPYLRLLETLHVFGIRANYMAQFREHLKQEGIEPDFEEISLPVRIQQEFLDRGLKVLRLPQGKSFLQEEGVVLEVDPHLRVTLDLRPKVEAARSDTEQEVVERAGGKDLRPGLKKLASFIDWEQVYFDLIRFKLVKGLSNLSFTSSSLRRILEEGSYAVLCPAGQLSPAAFGDLRRVQEIATGVLRKYAAAFYDRRRRAWEQEQLCLLTLTESDPNLSFGSYTLRVKKDFVEHIRNLISQGDELYRRDVEEFPSIHFDRHLYQPLLVSNRYFDSAPPELNNDETKFVRDLRHYLQQNPRQIGSKEVFLLRNLTRGKGIGFFDPVGGEGFYPDFIFWAIEDKKQWIAFIDPHGLRYAEGSFNDPKIQLYKELKKLELSLKKHCVSGDVRLFSFILSVKPCDEVKRFFGTGGHTREEFEEHNVLFLDDPEYIKKILGKIFR